MQFTTACCRGYIQSGSFHRVDKACSGLLTVASFAIMQRMNKSLICRAVMGFGASCNSDGDRKKCLSHWNNSAFHIAVSHSTNANEMFVWMPVVQALTQYPIIDWVGLHRQFYMKRLCFSKLIVGQTAALHLYNDHRLPPFPSSHPHQEFDISGMYYVVSFNSFSSLSIAP
jgi:hypothetical protein